MGLSAELCHSLEDGVQEKALKMTTLREIEPLVQRSQSGSGGSASEACCAAVEQHLSEQPYSQQACAALGCEEFGLNSALRPAVLDLQTQSSLGLVAKCKARPRTLWPSASGLTVMSRLS